MLMCASCAGAGAFAAPVQHGRHFAPYVQAEPVMSYFDKLGDKYVICILSTATGPATRITFLERQNAAAGTDARYY